MWRTSIKGFILTVSIFVLGVFCSSYAFADTGGESGSENNQGTATDTGNCNKSLAQYGGGVAQFDSCGGVFRLLNVNDPSGWPVDSEAQAVIRSKVVPACTKLGGEFYMLALLRARYAASGPSYTGQLARTRRVRDLISPYGSGKVPYKADMGLEFSKVKADHEAAIQYAKTHPDAGDFTTLLNTPWSDVTWFCWNAEWGQTTSSFDAWSYVDELDTLSYGPDSEVEKELFTKSDEVSVTFKHRLSYNKPTAASTSVFGPAETVWNTTITEDGKVTGGQGQTSFILYNSGPNRATIWDDMPFLAETTYKVNMKDADSKRVCSKITYTPKQIAWTENPSNFYNMNRQASTGTASSTACVVISKTRPVSTIGSYGSKTTVSVDSEGDIRGPEDGDTFTLTTDENGKDNYLYISTDNSSVKIRFSHEIVYHLSMCPSMQAPGDPPPWVCDWASSTPYTISGTYIDSYSGVHVGGDSKEPTSHVDENGDPIKIGMCSDFDEEERPSKCIQSPDKVSGGSFNGAYLSVDLNPGDIKKICQRITYTSKNIYLYPVELLLQTHYQPVRLGGTDYSEACVVITRPEDPTPPGGEVGPYSTGNGESGPMYAGETTTLGWSGKTQAYWTRRLMQWKAVDFQRPVSASQNSTNGNLLSGKINFDVCAWFRSNGPLINNRCEIAAGGNGGDDERFGDGISHARVWSDGWPSNKSKDLMSVGTFSENMKVPNEVGSKYCNSLGFQFQYYYGIQKNGGDITWTKDTKNSPYWKIYDAACRTIAKKPSFAVWNGSLFANGYVSTSLADRHLDPNLFNSLEDSGDRLNFGSWSEYLAVSRDSIEKFGSGAVYTNGSRYTDKNASTMTISNQHEGYRGFAEIDGGGSALIERLGTYLCGSSVDATYEANKSLLSSGVTGTHIVRLTGDTIGQDIKIANGPVRSIYQVPQVIVCANYASSDEIKISPNVERIDAWIYAPGKTINTCSAWSDYNTEALVNGYSGNNQCSKTLQINGPIIAGGILLNRSAGADPLTYSGNPTGGDDRAYSAEVFNLGADTYLWAYSYAGRYNSSYSEAYTRELPPRY